MGEEEGVDGQRFRLGGSPRPLPRVGGTASGTAPPLPLTECVESEESERLVDGSKKVAEDCELTPTASSVR